MYMELRDACARSGGFYDPRTRTCKLGNNYVRDLGDLTFEVATPFGRFTVEGYTPRLGDGGILFPFNNCGLVVGREEVAISCFAPAPDVAGASFVTTFSGRLATAPSGRSVIHT